MIFHQYKPHKYGVGPKEKRTVDGFVFDSIAEAKHYVNLKLLREDADYVPTDAERS